MIKIQERDKKILTLCYEHQFIEKKHIVNFFTSDGKARERIRELCHSGLLTATQSPVHEMKTSYRLTKYGMDFVKTVHPHKIFQRTCLSPTEYTHDSKVLCLRIRLEKLWNGTWIPECLLPQNKEIPDGIFLFPSGNEIYIELENSLKGKSRFLERLAKFTKPILVLYVTGRPEIEEPIKRIILKGQNLPPCGVVSLEAVLTGTPPIWSATEPLYPFNKKEF